MATPSPSPLISRMIKLWFPFPGGWNPEYLGPCYTNILYGRVGNPLSKKPDTTGAQERGPLSHTASKSRAPPTSQPYGTYLGIHTAVAWGEGAESPLTTTTPHTHLGYGGRSGPNWSRTPSHHYHPPLERGWEARCGPSRRNGRGKEIPF